MKRIIALFLVMVLSFSFSAEFQLGVINAEAADNTKIIEGEETEISFTSLNKFLYNQFIPKESGWYKFYSSGNCDVEGRIYRSTSTSSEMLVASDNYQKDFFGRYVISGNFKLIYYLEAGQQYILYSSPVENEGTYYIGIEKVPAATAMTITKQEELNIGIGQEYALELCYTPEDSSREKVTWVSDNPDVVFIDEEGICHFKSLGTANVTATTESGLTDSVIVNVVNYPEIKLNTEMVEPGIIGDDIIRYTFTPEAPGKYAFLVETDSGLVQGVPISIGIYDKDYNLVAESTDISTSEEVYCNMNAGEHYYLTYTTYSDHIGATGTAKVIRIGKPSIVGPEGIDTTDELWQEGEEIALENVKDILLDEEKQVGIAFFNAKSVHKFIPAEDGEYKFSAYGNEFVSFRVLNEQFDYIDSGRAPFKMKLEAGKTYIITSCISEYADSGLGEYSIEINKLPKAEKLEITQGESLSGYIRHQKMLTLNYTPEECESEELEWSSSDKSVVSVDDGSIYLNKIGKATITVTSESGLTDSIEVEVIHYPEIKNGETKVLTSNTKEISFTFIPEKSGVYKFTAKSDNAEMLLSGKVTKASMKPEATSAGNQVVDLEYNFEAGEIYYITVEVTKAESLGEMEFSLKKDLATTKVGDANQDGIINAEDALVVLKVAAKLVQLSEEENVLVDIDMNELVNAEDALEILKRSAKLVNEF